MTPAGEALPSNGARNDNGAKPPGFSKTIPAGWGADPDAFPAGWMDTLPTTEAFRYVRQPVATLPVYKESLYGTTGIRSLINGRIYDYSLTSVTYTGQVTLSVRCDDPWLGRTTLRLGNPVTIAQVGVRVPVPVAIDGDPTRVRTYAVATDSLWGLYASSATTRLTVVGTFT